MELTFMVSQKGSGALRSVAKAWLDIASILRLQQMRKYRVLRPAKLAAIERSNLAVQTVQHRLRPFVNAAIVLKGCVISL
ncbi:hypothetical protein ACVWWO_003171 [Bradyrhizobium sp. F1.13.1]